MNMKMKKALKIVAMVLVICTLVFAISQPVALAADVENLSLNVSPEVTPGMQNIGNTVSSYLMGAAIIITLIVLIYTGMKFIIGSANEKAEYKKSLIPIVVGCLIITAATVIVKILFSVSISE